MRILLDTAVLLWVLGDDRRLTARARAIVTDPTIVAYVSAVSVWEIAIKSALGQIHVDLPSLIVEVRRLGFRDLPFVAEHAVRVATLPPIHRDPFDRALVAQSIVEPLQLLTPDALLEQYGSTVIRV